MLYRLISLLLIFNIGYAYGDEKTKVPVETAAKSAILLEESTGKILFDKNSHERMSLASITKVMTMLLAVEKIESGKLKLNDIITCSEHAASMGGSTICFGTGEKLSVSDVLKGIAVSSGNDAAVAMAERVGGSEENFVKLMNKRAQELGMKDTHFENACGLDAANHYSSAYDISLMSRALIKHSMILNYMKIWSGKLYYNERKDPKKREFNLFNTNKLIRFYPGAIGVKTGSTSQAKFCLSGAAIRNGMKLVAVVMGCDNNKERFKEASKLLNYGFDNYQLFKITQKGNFISKANVAKGKIDMVGAISDRTINSLEQKGATLEFKKDIHLNNLTAPVIKGQIIGYVSFQNAGKEIGRANLLAEKSIDHVDIRDNLNKMLNDFLLN